MSWISDVKYEVGKLDISKRSLRKFGVTVGIVFLLLGIWFLMSGLFLFAGKVIIVLGGLLTFLGSFFPMYLKSVNLYWMTTAFILGWFVSRFLLTILFFMVLTPIALIAKLFKKEFLNLNYKKNQPTYWIRKIVLDNNYEKMY